MTLSDSSFDASSTTMTRMSRKVCLATESMALVTNAQLSWLATTTPTVGTKSIVGTVSVTLPTCNEVNDGGHPTADAIVSAISYPGNAKAPHGYPHECPDHDVPL